MKLKLFFMVFLSALSLTVIAQQKNVAVYVTGEQSGVTKVLGDQLVAAFSKSSEYKAVERTSSFLAEISKEQGYQRSGAVDDKEISRLGKQFGVQFVCVADISEAFGKKYVSARLINVENAEIVNSANEYSELNSMEELIRVSDALNSQLLGTKVVRSKIAAVTPGYTDLGLPSGTIWKDKNVSDYFYSYEDAVSTFGDRLPTKEQWEELIEYCEGEWTSNGYKFTSLINGKSITLPAAGWRPRYGSPCRVGLCCFYWTSTPDDSSDGAWYISFCSDVSTGIYPRLEKKFSDFSVRLVQKK